MPIVIKDYLWQQTYNGISIQIPSKGYLEKDIDLLTTKNYIKASYAPFFFEVFLLRDIKDSESKCFVTDKEIIFELCKVVPEQWEVLEANIDKSEKIELKKKILENIQNKAQEDAKTRTNRHHELKRVAVREQIAIDTIQREALENVKKTEKEKALKELKLYEDKKCIEHISDVVTKHKFKKQINYTPKRSNTSKEANNTQVAIPLPRKPASVNVTHTARIFPTPSRESKEEEEQEWLAKQAEARRTCGFVSEDLREEERNPQWLKEKGDDFFKAKNYLAAISAYTFGIKLSKNYVPLYVNRSAAQMAMGNYHRAIEDCSTAIELMTPICQANLNSRAKCIARRGAALCQIGLVKEGVSELEAASRLLPNDESLKADLEKLREQQGKELEDS